MPALCRSAAAYDSLPRGQRKPNAAIHRLRASQPGSSRLSTSSESGRASETAHLIHSARENPGLAGPSRAISSKGAGLLRGNRKSKAEVVLPLASSGLEEARLSSASPALARSKGEEEVDGGWATDEAPSAPASPKKQSRHTFGGARAAISGPVSDVKTGRVLPASTASPTPARKRVVDKRQIGLPSNFQHTGHIGAAAYGQAVSQVDAAQLKAQLSEVAAALSNFDLGPLPGVGAASTSSVGIQPKLPPSALEATASGDRVGAPRPESPEMEPLPAQDGPASFEDFGPVIAEREKPAREQDFGDVSRLSIRAVPGSSPKTADEKVTAPETHARDTLPPLMPERPSVHVASIRRRPASSTMGPSQMRATAGRGSIGRSYAALGLVNAAPSTSTLKGATRVPSTGGFGRAKRKPVPRGLAGILADPLAEVSTGASGSGSSKPLPAEPDPPHTKSNDDDFIDVDEDVPLSAGAADLERNVSVVGALPYGLNGRAYAVGGKGSLGRRSGAGTSAPYGSLRGSVRLSPLERAKLAAVKLEAAQRLVAEGAGTAEPDDLASLLRTRSGRKSDPKASGDSGTEATTAAAAAASIRMNGKRMVQGPSGAYITDTANGRWNSALSEITRALKDEGEQAGADANGDTTRDHEESIEDAMRRADRVLGTLGVQ